MREIKFRAWDTDTRVMEYESLLTIARRNEDSDEEVYQLMQYVGVKDKNNLEIYEGDILHDDHYELNGKVFFEDGSYLYAWDNILEPISESADRLEVIGNIYENPDLLKVQKEK